MVKMTIRLLVSFMDIFAQRLKNEREKRKENDPRWTQSFVAGKIGVARPTYTAYENGTKQPPMETANKIADLFDVTSDYLNGRSDNPKVRLKPEGNIFYFDRDNMTEEDVVDAKEYIDFLKQKRRKRLEKEKKDK